MHWGYWSLSCTHYISPSAICHATSKHWLYHQSSAKLKSNKWNQSSSQLLRCKLSNIHWDNHEYNSDIPKERIEMTIGSYSNVCMKYLTPHQLHLWISPQISSCKWRNGIKMSIILAEIHVPSLIPGLSFRNVSLGTRLPNHKNCDPLCSPPPTVYTTPPVMIAYFLPMTSDRAIIL